MPARPTTALTPSAISARTRAAIAFPSMITVTSYARARTVVEAPALRIDEEAAAGQATGRSQTVRLAPAPPGEQVHVALESAMGAVCGSDGSFQRCCAWLRARRGRMRDGRGHRAHRR